MEKKRVEDLTFGLTCILSIEHPWDCLHRHDEIELTFFITQNPVIYRIGGRVMEIEEEDTLLFWGAVPHQLIYIGPNVHQYTITVPPSVFLSWDLPDPFIKMILSGSIMTEHDKKLRNMDLASFPVWLEESGCSINSQRWVNFYRSAETRLRRFGGFSQPEITSLWRKCGPVTAPPAKANTSFLCMSDYITKNFKTDIRTDDIAEAAGLNSSYAMTLFRQESGITITDFITMLRVYEAQRLLLSSDMKIIDIAMEAGFGSMSNFYNCFKKVCGQNPKNYRKGLKS
jgi:AraC-like DNA-binding protein